MRQKQRVFSLFLLSPSSWRAWIEIAWGCASSPTGYVALLMEGVDRNCNKPLGLVKFKVALLMEGVDRNNVSYVVTAR